MKQNNLQKISDLLDNLEIGLKSFFYRIRKADRADRFHGPNCHGFYRAKEGKKGFSFRVTISEVTPLTCQCGRVLTIYSLSTARK